MSYDEHTLIEQPAINLFEGMNWQVCYCEEKRGVSEGEEKR